MNNKLTQKQEAFCLAYIETGNASEAYRLAYDAGNMKAETIHKRASELMSDGEVAGRIVAIRGSLTRNIQYRLEQAMIEAGEAFAVAKSAENGGAMVAAVQLRAKLNGLLVERKEVRTGPLDDASTEILLEMRRQLEQRDASTVH